MSKKQYPSQTTKLAVKVKSNQSTDGWKGFAMARFQVSVGQEYHEGDKLEAITQWGKDRFERIQFCVNDTLQRFNLMFEKGISEEQAFKITASLGKAWIVRNRPIIQKAPQAEIMRWEDWKSRPRYPKGFLQTEWLYQNNEEFKKAIDDNISAIWSRRQKADPHIYTEDKFAAFKSLSKRYLIEEMAAFSLMYSTEEAIDVYPGTALFAATLFQGKSLHNAPDGLGSGHFCRVDFVKNI